MTAKSPFSIIAKPIGPICNLDCRYCFYLEKEKLYPERSGIQGWAATDAVLENYIRQYTQAQPHDDVNFTWQGGEPTLLGVEFFEGSAIRAAVRRRKADLEFLPDQRRPPG